ncbi:MAG TPA: NlpC/P60 family protein [Halanaerobiales bacterium]|nr:NlpC/P60 family protein [Halanaerobiales bacterium]
MSSKKIVPVVIVLLGLLLTGCYQSVQVEISEPVAEKALEIALQQQGKPYQWGGRGQEEFDCSGLITWSYKEAVGEKRIFRIGDYITTDATMNDLYHWNVIMIPLEEIKPGDILFFTDREDLITHGGLFIKWVNENSFRFIHASSTRGEVVVEIRCIEDINGGHWLEGAGRFKRS